MWRVKPWQFQVVINLKSWWIHVYFIDSALSLINIYLCRPLICVFLLSRNTWLVMMTSSSRNIFRVTGYLCGEFTGDRWIPRTKASDVELWCFFDLRPNKRQWWGWWFETPSSPLWRHCDAIISNEMHIESLQTIVDDFVQRVYLSRHIYYVGMNKPIYSESNTAAFEA